MLDLIFCVLMIIIIVKANDGKVSDTLCNVALVIGFLAGILGLVQAFFIRGESFFWLLNIIVMLMAFALKKIAKRFAELHDRKVEAYLKESRKRAEKRHLNRGDIEYVNTDFDDPDVRFSGPFNENKDV